MYPLLTFHPLTEVSSASTATRVIAPKCTDSPAAGSLRLCPLQHITDPGVYAHSGVCLAPFVPLSGFDYPLNGLLLPNPLSRVSDSSVRGFHPFRVFLPVKSRTPLEASCSLVVNPPGFPRVTWSTATSELCSLYRAALAAYAINICGSRYSLGVLHLWGFLPYDRVIPLGATTLSHFMHSALTSRGTVVESFNTVRLALPMKGRLPL